MGGGGRAGRRSNVWGTRARAVDGGVNSSMPSRMRSRSPSSFAASACCFAINLAKASSASDVFSVLTARSSRASCAAWRQGDKGAGGASSAPSSDGGDGGDGGAAAPLPRPEDLDRIGDDALRDCHELDDAAFAATLAARDDAIAGRRAANGALAAELDAANAALEAIERKTAELDALMAAGAPMEALAALNKELEALVAAASSSVATSDALRRLEGAADDDEPSPAKSASSASTGAEE